jgi:AcrR family transcriptional regulator
VPKLWTQTIETHRREVREAILDTAAALVAEHGLLGVTMSQIAEETGIGRATLYKYFPDVEAILLAWHDRQITAHVAQLSEIRDQGGDAGERLEAVLEAYALLSSHSRGHQSTGVTELMHRADQLGRAQRQVHELIRGLLIEAAKNGDVRDDVPPDELAVFCVEALGRHASVESGDPSARDGHPGRPATTRILITTCLVGVSKGGDAGADLRCA